MSRSSIQVELSADLDYISKSPFKTYQSAPSKLCSLAFYQKAFQITFYLKSLQTDRYDRTHHDYISTESPSILI